jgi:hypothetical protein
MGPDDFKKRPTNANQPRPVNPRPSNARPGPAMDGFSSPARHAQPARHHPQKPARSTQQTAQPQPQVDLTPPPKKKKKLGLQKNNKLFLSLCVLAVFLIGFFVPNTPDKTNQPAQIPLVPPEFTVYYPNPMPEGLSTTKKSIVYSKNSFSFIMKQEGENRYFVNEEPASTDPGFTSLKAGISAPKAFSTTLGAGVTGSLDSGTVSAVKTDKNTTIVINCVKTTTCFATSQQIFSAMQVNTNVDSLRRGNL